MSPITALAGQTMFTIAEQRVRTVGQWDVSPCWNAVLGWLLGLMNVRGTRVQLGEKLSSISSGTMDSKHTNVVKSEKRKKTNISGQSRFLNNNYFFSWRLSWSQDSGMKREWKRHQMQCALVALGNQVTQRWAEVNHVAITLGFLHETWALFHQKHTN